MAGLWSEFLRLSNGTETLLEVRFSAKLAKRRARELFLSANIPYKQRRYSISNHIIWVQQVWSLTVVQPHISVFDTSCCIAPKPINTLSLVIKSDAWFQECRDSQIVCVLRCVSKEIQRFCIVLNYSSADKKGDCDPLYCNNRFSSRVNEAHH